MAPILYLPWNKETIYEPVPSLEQMAAVKIAVTLWNRADIKALMDVCPKEPRTLHLWGDFLGELSHLMFEFFLHDRPAFVEIEAKTKCYARELFLSEEAMHKVLSVIKPIGSQISLWKDFFSFDALLPKQLFWNVFGTIDHKKTAQALVKDCTLSLELRYKIACAYCLEDDVINLWGHLSEDNREAFVTPNYFSDIGSASFLPRIFAEELITLWSRAMKETGDMKKKFESLHISSEYQFLMPAVSDWNQTAVEYFLSKLTSSAKKDFLKLAQSAMFEQTLKCQKSDNYRSYFWLLSHMEENELTDVMAKSTVWVLIWCLDWPWQDLFWPVANHFKRFISSSDVVGLLFNMNLKALQGYRDYDYQQLFTDFWYFCSAADKRYAIKEFATNCDLLADLLGVGDKKNVQLILEDATDKELLKLIAYYREIREGSMKEYWNPTMRKLCPFLIEFVVGEEFKKREMEGKQFCADGEYCYQQVSTRFYKSCTETEQRHLLKEFVSDCDSLTDLFGVGEKKRNLKQILKDSTDEELQKIISYYKKSCLSLQYDLPKGGYIKGDAKLRWVCLFLLEFLVGEEFNNRR